MPQAVGGPLTGVRVIDLTIWVQGPVASTLLADLGADVVKVEKAGTGDFSRNLGALNGVRLQRDGQPNLMWQMCNRNKRGLALDLSREAAQPVFRRLVEQADVIVTNLHPSALAAFHATREETQAINPRLIYARGAGLGDRGPRAEDPCQDTVGMAYGGFMWTSANTSDEPYYPPGAMADVLSGTMLAFGVLAALRERERTGEGQYVCSSQLQSLMWMQYLNVGVAANFQEPFAGGDRKHPGSAMVNTYLCADGRWVALGLILDSHWPPFCKAVGLDHLLTDDRFAELWPRMTNAVPLARILEGHFLQRPADYWLERLRAAALWVSPVNSVTDLANGDAQVEANGYLATFDDGRRMPSGPFTLESHRAPTSAAPDHGADTDALLAELEFANDAIDALRVDGAVW
ncbi:hypothetical protein AYO38_08020 [bacterium SCGC AG-212-C10]|nr:hypothetical protein AYO38_08020 [bacterium SCGC AG-212-C10]